MDSVYVYLTTFLMGTILALVFTVNLLKWKKGVKTKTYNECEDKNCVRCTKYLETKSLAVSRFNEYTREKSPEDIQVLQRIKSSTINIDYTDPNKRQKTSVFFMQGLTSLPWPSRLSSAIEHDRSVLEQNIQVIYCELKKIVDDKIDGWIVNNTPTGCWTVFHLINQGKIIEKNVSVVPNTYKIVNTLLSAMQNCVFGNVTFSVIYPGTIITEHFGPTNIRLRCHLGLSISPLCSITVDGHKKSWKYGKTLVFDDSYLHGVKYAQTANDEMRAVLLVDMWHSDISEEEKKALMIMFENK